MDIATVSRGWRRASGPATEPILATRDLLPQDFLDRLSLGKFVDQLIEIADLAHGRLFDVFDTYAADHARDQRPGWVHLGRLREEILELVLFASTESRLSWLCPVSQRMISSTSAFVRPFFSAFVT